MESVENFKCLPPARAEWLKLKETLVKFQAAKGKKNQKRPNAIGSEMKAQWSSVAIAWQEATCGMISTTCQKFETCSYERSR